MTKTMCFCRIVNRAFPCVLLLLTSTISIRAQLIKYPPQRDSREYTSSSIPLMQIADCSWIQPGNLRDYREIRYEKYSGGEKWDEIGTLECHKPEYEGRRIGVLVELPVFLGSFSSVRYDFQLDLTFTSPTLPEVTQTIRPRRSVNILAGEYDFVFLAIGPDGKAQFQVGPGGNFTIRLSVRDFKFIHQETKTEEKGSFEIYNGATMKTYLLNQGK